MSSKQSIIEEVDFIKSIIKSNPIKVIDIGAARGLHPRWNDLADYISVLGFEPDEREYTKLVSSEAQNTKYFNIGLYERKGEIDFFVTRKQLRSSIFPVNREFVHQFPNPERFETEKIIKINVDTLDNQLKLAQINDIDFIKIDTQGSELPILKGAADTLKNGVFGLEVEFAPIYVGQPLFSDIDSYLRSFGFQLFGLTRYHWKRTIARNIKQQKGQLVFGDAIYFNSYERYVDTFGDDKERNRLKIIRAIIICLTYGFFDYALEIGEKAKRDNIIENDEFELIKNSIASTIPKIIRFPEFKGKFIIANVLYKLYEYFKPNPWVEIDEEDNLVEG